MITKCSQNSSGMKTCCHIRSLIWQIKVGNFCNIIIENKNIAGLNVTMNDARISLLMQVFKPFCSTNSNFYTLWPCKDRTRLCSFNTFPPWLTLTTKTLIMQVIWASILLLEPKNKCECLHFYKSIANNNQFRCKSQRIHVTMWVFEIL